MKTQQKQVLGLCNGMEPDQSLHIVAAAYELLETEGLEGLTVRAVLKKTGLARRAFYEQYGGKDDLVLAVFEQTIRMAAKHYADQMEALPDPLSRIQLIVSSIVLGTSGADGQSHGQGSRRSAALTREHLRLAEARPTELESALAPLINLIADQLEDGMAAGHVRYMSGQRLAALVYNLVSSTVHNELIADESRQTEPEQRKQLADDIWDFCRRAIVA